MLVSRGSAHLRRGLVGALLAWGCLALLPAAAQAGVAAGAAPTFPAEVTVGPAAIPVSITLSNEDTPPNLSNTICNFGDPFPCPAGDPGITLIPSCGQLGAFSVCTPAGADPDVFAPSATGTGAPGTACAGMVFDIVEIDPAFGQLRFTPQGGASVVLPTPGSLCTIEFDVSAFQVPTVDQNPIAAGFQTVQIVDNTQRASEATSFITASARGTSRGTTVNPAPPGCEPSGPGSCDPVAPARASMTVMAPSKGCRRRSFRVVVRGMFIESVVFKVDGRRIARRTQPNARGDSFSVRVRPGLLKPGRHRITTQARFALRKGARPRTLSRSFRTCA